MHRIFTQLLLVLPIIALRSPTISYISQEQIKNIGSSVDLTCVIQYADGYPITWTKMGKSKTTESVPISTGTTTMLRDSRFKIQHVSHSSTYTLTIKDLQETDAGYYSCQIIISLSLRISAEVELYIRRPPIIFDNSTRSLLVIEGQSIKLECYAGGYPQPFVSWRRDHNEVLPTGGSIYRGSVLKINSVTKEHRGTYFCVAENGVGRGTRRNIAMEVQFAPIVSATRKRVGQAIQYDMDLECKVEAYPPPAIEWLKDHMTLSNNQHHQVSYFTTSDEITFSVLRIITVEKRQFGLYTCKAANIFGQSEDSVELFETVIPMCPPACGN